jgi:homoserine dehydrogenase
LEANQNSIGLFGFGCVGQGLYNVLSNTGTVNASVKKICVKDTTKKRAINHSFFTSEKEDLLRNGKYNIIVELINNSDDALDIVKAALQKGKRVVSANKKMLAENFTELLKIVSETEGTLLYEGACGGSIPVIRVLEQYYGEEEIESIRAIVNGSSNYILTRMEAGGLSYNEALASAAALGFAEEEPSFDTEGYDSKFKLCILAVHAFGVIPLPGDVLNLGIQNILQDDLLYAASLNSKIKLISYLRNEKGKLTAYVLPQFVPLRDELANVTGENNGIEIHGAFSGRQFYSGKGAGSYPTGCAVLSDVSAASVNYRYGYGKLKRNRLRRCVINNDHEVKVYIRYKSKAELNAIDLIETEKQGVNYIIGNVTLGSLFKIQKSGLFVCAF